MKRWVILWIIMLSVLSGYAQKGMHVDALFESRFKHDKRAVEVLIKGKELKKYHLTLFRSLTVTDAPAVSEEIEELVSRDALAAVDKEEGRVGKKLYYGFTVFRHGMTITGIYSIGILWSRLAAKRRLK